MADSNYRETRVAELRNRAEQARERARVWADKKGEPMRFVRNGTVFLLVDYTEERGPVYRRTHNVNAAISTAANLVRATPYNLSGTNILAGIWDGGNVRATHTEFGGRVTNIQSVSLDDHATHVAGTMIARGAAAAALGMAPAARLDAYDFFNDLSEMTGRAMATPGQAGKIQISNHSYGYLAGWEAGFSPIRWYGTWTNGVRESDSFGQYSTTDRDLDRLLYDAPYYLPFWSSGNDRNDNAPANGTEFQYFLSGSWRTTNYNSSIHPISDGWKQGGYDTISFGSVAKNILLVGAVNDAVSGGQRSIANATMTSFSSWGPTDDGRIKPDIVANGAGLYSSLAGSDTSYGTYSGTSMSAPNAAGSALLILQRFRELFPGQYLWASTIKALIIHTADDLPPVGPDYRTGWGLMNTKAAVDHLALHHANPGAPFLVEGRISTTNTAVAYDVKWSQTNAMRATLVWTDPPGVARTGLNNTNLALRNNLDLRVISPSGATNFPWILNPANPTNAAVFGNNIRDNVEQVYLANPGASGIFKVRITYTGTLSNNFQNFSLIMSGISPLNIPDAPAALWVGETNATDLAALWTASSGATGYVFDAHTSEAFANETPGSSGSETFSGIGPSSSSYATRIWTNNGVRWTAYQARTDYTIDGRAIGLRNAAGAFMVSGPISGGVDEISLVHRRNTGSGTTFDLFINETKVAGPISLGTSITTTRVTGINVSGDFTIMVTNSGGNVARFDNLLWTHAPLPGGSFVSGYSNRPVAATSLSVTGLSAGMTYFLRARAMGADGISGYSPVASVSTPTNMAKMPGAVLLHHLAQTYDGSIKSVSVTSEPEDLAVMVDYDQTPVNAGSYFVTAVINDALYEGGTTGILVIARAAQTITFANPGDQIATNVVELHADADSGLPVTTSVISGPAVIDGNRLSFAGTGVVIIAAHQSGDANWLAADPVTNTLAVFAFADENKNEIPDEWELDNFGSLDAVTETSDADDDGMLDWQEYIAGTDPNDPHSLLQVDSDAVSMIDGKIIIQWSSSSNRVYDIGRKTNLTEPFLYVTSGLLAAPPLNVYTDAPPGEGPWFYRIKVGLEP